MTDLLIDSSVLIKWFHREGESELAPARSLRAAHVSGAITAHVLDLATYEVGNVLLRVLGWDPVAVADQLDDVDTILGPPFLMCSDWWRRAAQLGRRHQLTFYDAAWAAAADCLDITLVSADRQLVGAGLAESPTETVGRLKLAPADSV